MEIITLNESPLMNTSHSTISVDGMYRENVSASPAPSLFDCDTILSPNFPNQTQHGYSSSEVRKMLDICLIVLTVRRVGFWSTLAVGAPGNILALLTILTFPKSVGTFYLALLSLSDLLAIITKVISVAMVTFKAFNDASCKVIMTATDFTAIYANWVLVFICFERLVTVVFPLKKNYYCTMRRGHQSAVILAIVILLFAGVNLWMITAWPNQCATSQIEFYSKWLHVTNTLYSYLPSLLLLLMVLIIWRALKKIQKARNSIFGGDDGSTAAALTKRRLEDQAKMERSITAMLFFASVTFVVLTLPLCVVIAADASGLINPSQLNKLYLDLAFAISLGFVTLTHAVNFFIYLVSTKRFRQQVLNLIRRSNFTRLTLDRTNNTVEDQV